MRKFEIHVKYTKGEEKYRNYHAIDWTSVSIERAIKNVHKIMEVMDVEGNFRFAGAKVIENNQALYTLERNNNPK